jgi:hypothetical protein
MAKKKAVRRTKPRIREGTLKELQAAARRLHAPSPPEQPPWEHGHVKHYHIVYFGVPRGTKRAHIYLTGEARDASQTVVHTGYLGAIIFVADDQIAARPDYWCDGYLMMHVPVSGFLDIMSMLRNHTNLELGCFDPNGPAFLRADGWPGRMEPGP